MHSSLVRLILSSFAALLLGWLGWTAGQHAGRASGTAAQHFSTAQAPDSASAGNSTAQRVVADPLVVEAIEAALARGSGQGSWTEICMQVFPLAESLPDGSFPAAIAAARNASASAAAGALAGYWAERDLPAARAWVLDLPEEERVQYLEDIIGTWLKLDPLGPLSWLESLAPEQRVPLVRQLGTGFTREVLKSNPQRVAELLLAVPFVEGDEPTMRSLFWGWAEQAPAQAAARALALSGGVLRFLAVEAVAESWARRDAAAAGAWVQAIPEPMLADKAVAAFARGLAEQDGRAAAQFVADLPATEGNQKALRDVLEQWAARDAAAAMAWVDALPEDAPRDELLDAALRPIARENTEEALQLLAQRAEGQSSVPFVLIEIFESLYTTRGADAAIDLAAPLPEMMRGVAQRIVFEHRIQDEGASALGAWTAAQPEGETRVAAARATAKALADNDPLGAAAWIRSLPPGASRDAPIETIADALLEKNASAMADLVLLISDESESQRLTSFVVSQWAKRDARAARQWLGKAKGLPPARRAELLQVLKAEAKP